WRRRDGFSRAAVVALDPEVGGRRALQDGVAERERAVAIGEVDERPFTLAAHLGQERLHERIRLLEDGTDQRRAVPWIIRTEPNGAGRSRRDRWLHDRLLPPQSLQELAELDRRAARDPLRRDDRH